MFSFTDCYIRGSMHTLFSNDAMFNHGDMMIQTIQRLKDISYINLLKSQEYFRAGNFAVQNQHILTRLIKQIKLPSKGLLQLSAEDVQKYYEDIRQNDYRIGNMLGLVTSTSYGTIRKSDFYSNDVTEVVIATTSTYSQALTTPWQDLEPVQVHRHPYDTTNYGLLDKRQIMGGKGLAIISINIPVFALQFLKFQQWIAETNPRVKPTFQQFITQYPLQNMIKSHNNIAMINRTIKAYRGIKGHDLQPRQAFWLLDDMPLADQIIGKMVLELKRQPRFFESILMHMPTLTRTGYDAIRLPIDVDVRQNRWVWIMARTWILDFLLEVEHSFNRGRKEGATENEILKALQVIDSDGTFRINNLPVQMKQLINAELKSIKTRIKTK